MNLEMWTFLEKNVLLDNQIISVDHVQLGNITTSRGAHYQGRMWNHCSEISPQLMFILKKTV